MPETTDILADIPCRVLGRVQHAFRQLHAWNDAIKQARRMEVRAGAPGRYEYDLRYGSDGASLWQQIAKAEATLALFETVAATNGVDPEAVYAALGGKPTLLAEGPQVHKWHPTQRPAI